MAFLGGDWNTDDNEIVYGPLSHWLEDSPSVELIPDDSPVIIHFKDESDVGENGPFKNLNYE